jgi:hypothetical protein
MVKGTELGNQGEGRQEKQVEKAEKRLKPLRSLTQRRSKAWE